MVSMQGAATWSAKSPGGWVAEYLMIPTIRSSRTPRPFPRPFPPRSPPRSLARRARMGHRLGADGSTMRSPARRTDSSTAIPAPRRLLKTGLFAAALMACAATRAAGPPVASSVASCLSSGDGYLHARVAGAIDAKIDWPNSGTKCQGESKTQPPGVRLSFQRDTPGKPDLLFVFGLTGIREGQPAHATGTNLTVIVQGTSKIFGTLGDSRCTVDSLTQKRLSAPGAYRVEARGFCTQPARAVRGNGAVLVSTFDFAGLVNYGIEDGSDAVVGSDAPARK
jgi:hypothetical protein